MSKFGSASNLYICYPSFYKRISIDYKQNLRIGLETYSFFI